jgi:hypothetical protein
MKRIRVDSTYVTTDDRGRVLTWELCPEPCPILTYTDDQTGDTVVAAMDHQGRSWCLESRDYQLKSFELRRALRGTSRARDQPPPSPPRQKEPVAKSAAVQRASKSANRKQRPPTRYQQFMKLYLTAEGQGGFKAGASKWTSMPVEDRATQPIDELVKRALR